MTTSFRLVDGGLSPSPGSNIQKILWVPNGFFDFSPLQFETEKPQGECEHSPHTEEIGGSILSGGFWILTDGKNNK